jgi:lycopene beta-cyclase
MEEKNYDYIIIGAGAAGLQLALALLEDPYFRDIKIALIERELKNGSDKTWCYWETGTGAWDPIIDFAWDKGLFRTSGTEVLLSLTPYRYKKLTARSFYEHARNQIRSTDQITWITDEIKAVQGGDRVTIRGENHTYTGRQVFDSRVDPAFYASHSWKKVWQHFKGWEIETEKDTFSPEIFTMMDFRIKWKNSTSFTYILPTTTRHALVEFTFFTPFFVRDEDYDECLRKYISDCLQIKNYRITRVEKGIIPMSDYPFHRHHQPGITKIGTAGGWVRPSSGYSFKNSAGYVRQLIHNLKNQKLPHQGIAGNRFRLYDTLFLDLLQNHNAMGEALFTSMYTRNTIRQIFKFLDEKTSFLEDARIISTFPTWPFLKAAMRQIRQ